MELKNTIIKKVLKYLKIDDEFYKKKYKSLNRKKVLLITTETLLGSASTIGSLMMGSIIPDAGIIISSSTALLTSIAILKTNWYNSKLKKRYTKSRVWFKVITMLYEKTLKQSVVVEKIELMKKKIYKK